MRPLSLQSDLENEIWLLMKELIEEHDFPVDDAVAAIQKAARNNRDDCFSHMST